MKAVIMAGGAGTRLRPLTMSTPKPLLPVAERPMVEHLARLLLRHHIDEAVVTVHYLAPMVRSELGDGSELGMKLAYITEPRPVGTAGSVKMAESMLSDGTFIVVSGDGLTDIDLTALIDFHRTRGAMVTVCLSRRDNPLGLGIVVTDDDGRVTRFLEKPGWGQVFTNTVNTGIYVMEPEVLSHIKADEDLDWSGDIFPALLAAGEPIYGYTADGYWEDVGTIEAYRRVQIDALRGEVQVDIPGHEISPGIWIGNDVDIDPTARITGPLVLGDNVRIGAGAQIDPYTAIGRHCIVDEQARVERSVLLDNVYVGAGAQLRGCVIGQSSEVLNRARVDEGSSVGDECRVGEEAVVTGGADIFPHKTIDAGVLVSDSVVWESQGARPFLSGRHLAGTVNLDVTPEGVARLAGAYASLLPKRASVAVGRDHAVATAPVALVLEGALAACGMDVSVMGTTPTSVLRNAVARGHDGGVMVRTAPGRPDQVELVLIDAAGRDLDPRRRQELQRIVERHDTRRPLPGEVGSVSGALQPVDDYVTSVLAATDVTGIEGAGLRIVVDTAGGTCGAVLPTLMASLDVDMLAVNTRMTPANPTETTAERAAALERLGLMVASSRAALGLRLDPTGDRLSIVDETGRVLTDDRALLVVLDLIAAERRSGVVALPVTTTRVAEQVTAFHGVQVLWTPTGSQALSAAAGDVRGLILAGDGNGGFVIPAVGDSPDAMAAMVQILGLVARTRLTLRQIDTRIPATTLLKESIPTPWAKKALVMAAVRESAGEVPLDETEGIRLLVADDAWVLIAPDPDEASVRMWVESPDQAAAQSLAHQWRAVVAAAGQSAP